MTYNAFCWTWSIKFKIVGGLRVFFVIQKIGSHTSISAYLYIVHSLCNLHREISKGILFYRSAMSSRRSRRKPNTNSEEKEYLLKRQDSMPEEISDTAVSNGAHSHHSKYFIFGFIL